MRHKCYEESGDRRDGSAVKSMCFRRPEFAFQHSGQAAPNQRSLFLYIHTTPSHTCRHACTHPHKHAHTLTHMCIHTHTRTFKNTINLKREILEQRMVVHPFNPSPWEEEFRVSLGHTLSSRPAWLQSVSL